MENLKTTVYWVLTDFCKSECSYCPISLRGGAGYPETKEYLRVINAIINNYTTALGRTIDWILTGGEPLDIDDIAVILKTCKTDQNSITLHTNGGKLWIDWWAIEPYVDILNLTFHYWQNPSLIKYLSDLFKTKGKQINITAPIRNDHFEEDLNRVVELEDLIDRRILKTLLYKEADQSAGLFDYDVNDLCKLDLYNLPKEHRTKVIEENKKRTKPGPLTPSAEQKVYFEKTTWKERHDKVYNSNPSFTHQLCNAGIEYLNIGAQGWASGSQCGNMSLGNVWKSGWAPPSIPQTCTMISCIHASDRKITKFPLPGH